MQRTRLLLFAVLFSTAIVFLLGIHWGLPSRAVDPYLFGDEPVWSGEKIAALAPADEGSRGADVDANPLPSRNQPIVLNETDAQRAEIIRRYRLFSYQPDEMITFKSLAQIRAHRGDPRLYQYGGLWIYPIGALLAAADVVGYVDLRGGPEGQAYYLDHPEAFGRFYVVARLYSALWGLVAVAAVFWIIQRLTGSPLIAAAGALAFAFMPVVVTMAHEAKPHLPGLALTLLAVVAATKYVEAGRRRLALLAGVSCGAAFGMVLSALLAFAILPVMVLLRCDDAKRRLLALMISTVGGLLVYAITNPYVPINALRNPEILRSNLGNSTAMYAMSLGGAGNAVKLIAAGASPIVLMVGTVGAAAVILRQRGETALWLLAAPAALVALQFILLARDKPPEYARFALVIDAFLLVASFAALSRLQSRRGARAARAAACGFAAITFLFALPYVRAFIRDARVPTSRLETAKRLAASADQGARSVRLFAEPAPYIAPPTDLFRYTIIYAPFRVAVDADVTLALDLSQATAPISWADVQFGMSAPRPTPPATLSSRP